MHSICGCIIESAAAFCDMLVMCREELAMTCGFCTSAVSYTHADDLILIMLAGTSQLAAAYISIMLRKYCWVNKYNTAA